VLESAGQFVARQGEIAAARSHASRDLPVHLGDDVPDS
jgi:hypothetical protein